MRPFHYSEIPARGRPPLTLRRRPPSGSLPRSTASSQKPGLRCRMLPFMVSFHHSVDILYWIRVRRSISWRNPDPKMPAGSANSPMPRIAVSPVSRRPSIVIG